jgi:hypothetical protein
MVREMGRMSDLISRQAAIDALWIHITNILENSDYDLFIQDVYKMAYRHISELIQNLPSAEPTLYGYKLEHLAFVAALLQNKGVTEENLTDVLNSVDWIVGMILKEAKEKTMQDFIKNEVEE